MSFYVFIHFKCTPWTNYYGRRIWNRAGHYIFVLWFLLLSSSFFFLFYSPIFSRRRLDLYHTSTHGGPICNFFINFLFAAPFTFLTFFVFTAFLIFKKLKNGIHILQNNKVAWLFLLLCNRVDKRHRPINIIHRYRNNFHLSSLKCLGI